MSCSEAKQTLTIVSNRGTLKCKCPLTIEKEFAVTCAVSHEISRSKGNFWILLAQQFKQVKESFNSRVKSEERVCSLTFTAIHPEVPMSDWLNWILLAADSFMVENAAGRKVSHCRVPLV